MENRFRSNNEIGSLIAPEYPISRVFPRLIDERRLSDDERRQEKDELRLEGRSPENKATAGLRPSLEATHQDCRQAYFLRFNIEAKNNSP